MTQDIINAIDKLKQIIDMNDKIADLHEDIYHFRKSDKGREYRDLKRKRGYLKQSLSYDIKKLSGPKEKPNIIKINPKKLSDILNIEEKSEDLPCGMDAVWDLLEKASGRSILDAKTDDVIEQLDVDLDVVKKKAYRYCGLKKKQTEYLIELIKDYEVNQCKNMKT